MEPVPAEPCERSLRFVTLNVAHGRKLSTHQALLSPRQLRDNLRQVGEVLQEAEADVVGLQEADGPSAWSGRFDHVALLADILDHPHHFRGDHNHFELAGARVASGTALTARHALTRRQSHRFDTSWRDTKGFVVATMTVPEWRDLEVDVVSVHLEPIRPRLRGVQIRQLVEALANRPRPLIIMGDLNCTWSEDTKHFRPLVEELRVKTHQPFHKAPTYPSHRPYRRLDWILLSPELEFSAYETIDNPVSDHLGVAASVRPAEAWARTGEPATGYLSNLS